MAPEQHPSSFAFFHMPKRSCVAGGRRGSPQRFLDVCMEPQMSDESADLVNSDDLELPRHRGLWPRLYVAEWFLNILTGRLFDIPLE